MAGVRIRDVSKHFGEVRAVDRISMEIAPGEFVALLGPSGCGKTTLLRLVAGFERADAGAIEIGGELVSGPGRHVPPERRRIGMVFQAYALWPHMTVAENVAYALRVRRVPAAERARRVTAALASVGMAELGERRPSELSGGQRQRVALARCLAMEPALVLLDEPLANLDVHLRDSMQAEFKAFHAATGATMLYVTHDQAEAMALADRIAVLRAGVVQQVARPHELYREPATPMVAEFVGRGMVLPAEVERGGADGGRWRARVLGAPVVLRGRADAGGRQQVCVRPEHLSLVAIPGPDPGSDAGIAARVERLSYHGAATTVYVRAVADPAHVLYFHVPGEPPRQGDEIRIAVNDGWVIPAPPPLAAD